MENQSEIFVFASTEVQEFLADNSIDVLDLLLEKGCDVKKGFSKDPSNISSSGYKEPTSVILASAALVLSLTPIIKKTIEAISRKNLLVEEKLLVPVEDSHGNIVKDKNGDPILQWVKKSKLLNPEKKGSENTNMVLKGPFGFELSFSEKEKS